MRILYDQFLIILLLGFFSPVNAATISVNNPFDANDANPGDGICETAVSNSTCTLRAAISEANSLSGNDVINLPSGTYVLTLTGADEDLNSSGDLDISNSVTINGTDRETTILDANQIDRVFQIISGTLTLNSLTVTGGLRSGGVTDVSSVGGGIDVRSMRLVMNDVAVINNSSGLDGGGIYSNNGHIEIINSTIESNSASASGGGVAIYRSSGNTSSTNLDITNSVIRSNNAEATGGGIYCLRCTASISDSYIHSNTSAIGGGGLFNYQANSIIKGSTLHNNIDNSEGGGIKLISTNLTIINSTISGNGVGQNDGLGGIGGGVHASASDIKIYNSTIVNNAAYFGASIATENVTTLQLANSIISKSISYSGNINDIMGSFSSMGYNLFDRMESADSTDIQGDPLLAPLADNGGSTPTHLPLPGSPAIDAGNISGCMVNSATLSNDQRMVSRPLDGNNDAIIQCDIGAIEREFSYGIIFDKVDGLVTTESGYQAQFRTRLNMAPTAEVSIPISSSNTNEGVLSTNELVFNDQNWNQWQQVIITGVDDTIQDAAIKYLVITGQTNSLDNNFNLIDPIDLVVTNYDDESSLVSISPTTITTTEGSNATVRIYVDLLGPPTDVVNIKLSINDFTEGTFLTTVGIGITQPDGSLSDGSYHNMEFTPESWKTSHSIGLSSVTDNIFDNDVSYEITVSVTSNDISYNNLNVAPIIVQNINSDIPQDNPSSSNGGGGGYFSPLWILLLVIGYRWGICRRSSSKRYIT